MTDIKVKRIATPTFGESECGNHLPSHYHNDHHSTLDLPKQNQNNKSNNNSTVDSRKNSNYEIHPFNQSFFNNNGQNGYAPIQQPTLSNFRVKANRSISYEGNSSHGSSEETKLSARSNQRSFLMQQQSQQQSQQLKQQQQTQQQQSLPTVSSSSAKKTARTLATDQSDSENYPQGSNHLESPLSQLKASEIIFPPDSLMPTSSSALTSAIGICNNGNSMHFSFPIAPLKHPKISKKSPLFEKFGTQQQQGLQQTQQQQQTINPSSATTTTTGNNNNNNSNQTILRVRSPDSTGINIHPQFPYPLQLLCQPSLQQYSFTQSSPIETGRMMNSNTIATPSGHVNGSFNSLRSSQCNPKILPFSIGSSTNLSPIKWHPQLRYATHMGNGQLPLSSITATTAGTAPTTTRQASESKSIQRYANLEGSNNNTNHHHVMRISSEMNPANTFRNSKTVSTAAAATTNHHYHHSHSLHQPSHPQHQMHMLSVIHPSFLPSIDHSQLSSAPVSYRQHSQQHQQKPFTGGNDVFERGHSLESGFTRKPSDASHMYRNGGSVDEKITVRRVNSIETSNNNYTTNSTQSIPSILPSSPIKKNRKDVFKASTIAVTSQQLSQQQQYNHQQQSSIGASSYIQPSQSADFPHYLHQRNKQNNLNSNSNTNSNLIGGTTFQFKSKTLEERANAQLDLLSVEKLQFSSNNQNNNEGSKEAQMKIQKSIESNQVDLNFVGVTVPPAEKETLSLMETLETYKHRAHSKEVGGFRRMIQRKKDSVSLDISISHPAPPQAVAMHDIPKKHGLQARTIECESAVVVAHQSNNSIVKVEQSTQQQQQQQVRSTSLQPPSNYEKSQRCTSAKNQQRLQSSGVTIGSSNVGTTGNPNSNNGSTTNGSAAVNKKVLQMKKLDSESIKVVQAAPPTKRGRIPSIRLGGETQPHPRIRNFIESQSTHSNNSIPKSHEFERKQTIDVGEIHSAYNPDSEGDDLKQADKICTQIHGMFIKQKELFELKYKKKRRSSTKDEIDLLRQLDTALGELRGVNNNSASNSLTNIP